MLFLFSVYVNTDVLLMAKVQGQEVKIFIRLCVMEINVLLFT
jgi:hypothetical protein